MKSLFLLLCFVIYSASTEDRRLVTISYTLWFNDNIIDIRNINITVPKDATFYQVMNIAAERDSQYKFEAIEYDFGHYITEIGGIQESKEENLYWMIYQTPSIPNSHHPPSDDLLTKYGVDRLYVQEDEHYLFWYKRVIIHH